MYRQLVKDGNNNNKKKKRREVFLLDLIELYHDNIFPWAPPQTMVELIYLNLDGHNGEIGW